MASDRALRKYGGMSSAVAVRGDRGRVAEFKGKAAAKPAAAKSLVTNR